jgi:hypothetical protein
LPGTAGEDDAALVLGRLLDLRGSVELAAILSRGSLEMAAPLAVPASSRVRQELVEELAEVRAQLAYAFSRWTARSSRVAGPEVLDAALATRAALGPRERRTTTIAQSVWGPIAEEARKELERARRSVRHLSRALEPELVAMGPRAARLCALDRALGDAMETAVSSRMDRLMSATEAHLVRQLALDIASLSATESPRIVDAWLAPAGAVRTGLTLISSVAHAAVEWEARRVLSLVDAVTAAATKSDPFERGYA